ncbi:E3 ubiquitin-protein ligase rnf8-B-like [Acanthaster planci]|uniref:E3 ubiquitin-protein ligase rnf8-B-like n=1 Tax=Acanthaster planci TaxID=133434 RepID=A0A8B7YCP8_ACAPL|nr:E3 ubiquitin-protein ligase rnf8-B-like [Acanthaster planci]XP_022091025.1 E3 ubiquitin-protein ligase rnf8-B-like [Acanthaster planci]XP_022091026.1 E3 ubiquitin-protein ligase rnf8-B-like [Acanthaster planci]XP_022091027.1 E3 ubiquitin-protein ligase rnf8-B-like [Acanthaster planci]XP_022091028.1 E3 ubiquitin-protein ligase rnf8-B-like [Acanthaster planci]XP_022091029.1 E3 ubiquitin-protein ligase rnf8-B-like [Acanthaster planci]
MTPPRRTCKMASFRSSESQPSGDTRGKSQAKLHIAPSRTGKLSLSGQSDTGRCTRSQTALRSKENVQLQINRGPENKMKSNRIYNRGPALVDQASFSGIFYPKECHTGKDLKHRKASSKSLRHSKTRKCSGRRIPVKSKKRNKRDIPAEDTCTCLSTQETLHRASSETAERTSVSNIPATPHKDSGDDALAFSNNHETIKARISLMRRRILEEQARVQGLREELARNQSSARASLSCRRIRIHKELAKLREKVQSEDRRRLRAEDHRIRRRLAAGRRQAEGERLAMRTRLAQEWREQFRCRKGDVRRARLTLREQARAYEAEKRQLLGQLQKDWTAQLHRVQEVRDRLEMEMARNGLQWNGVTWRTAAGKHKYSLRQAPRQKANIYCVTRKINKKGPVGSNKQDGARVNTQSPPSGATVYRETKQKTLTELYQLLDSELRCSICSELFISAVVLNCSHTFCSFCITQWKRRTDRCPICRASISSRNPLPKLDTFLAKFVRLVGREAEKKRAETVRNRQDQEKELQQGGRTWGNLANHSLDDLDPDDDDFDDSFDSDSSEVDEFLEILQHRVGGPAFRRFFGFGLGDVEDIEDMEDDDWDFLDDDEDDEDLLSSLSSDEPDFDDFADLDGNPLDDDEEDDDEF